MPRRLNPLLVLTMLILSAVTAAPAQAGPTSGPPCEVDSEGTLDCSSDESACSDETLETLAIPPQCDGATSLFTPVFPLDTTDGDAETAALAPKSLYISMQSMHGFLEIQSPLISGTIDGRARTWGYFVNYNGAFLSCTGLGGTVTLTHTIKAQGQRITTEPEVVPVFRNDSSGLEVHSGCNSKLWATDTGPSVPYTVGATESWVPSTWTTTHRAVFRLSWTSPKGKRIRYSTISVTRQCTRTFPADAVVRWEGGGPPTKASCHTYAEANDPTPT